MCEMPETCVTCAMILDEPHERCTMCGGVACSASCWEAHGHVLPHSREEIPFLIRLEFVLAFG